jgi:mannitol-1-phosphate/altronate dehydrogenase
VIDSVYSPGNPQKVAELLKHSNLVTLTITQNGYNVDVTNKPPTLSTTPEVLFDSEVLNQRLAGKSFEEIGEGLGYKTALASIVEELARRFLTKELPPAIMSLDNTPPAPNGEVIRAALIGFAQRVEQQSEQEDGKNSLRGFTGFIESDLPILHTVVDRITPNQDSIDRLWIEEAMEFFDPATIVTEGHRSLIIQVDDPKKYIDRGIVSIPDLTIVEGVCEVPDIRPEMELKSRCLNSLDVVAAQIGTRLGLKTIGQFVTHPVLAALEDRVLATELARGVVSVDRRRADEFAEEVVQRRENLEISGINILSRLNNKGSDKMPNRIGAAIAAVSCAHETEEALTLTFACYLRNIIDKTDENGNELHLQDDAPDRIRDIVQTFNSRGEAIVRRELSRNPAILRIIDNGDKLRKTEEYGNESNFEATNSKELHRDFYTSESINSGYNFRQGLDNARKLLTDEGYGELGDELVQIYEEAGIRGVLEEQTWLFGQGTDENGMLVKVGEIQTFQRRLIEYYTAMDKHSVIDVALTIANPIKRPDGYNP